MSTSDNTKVEAFVVQDVVVENTQCCAKPSIAGEIQVNRAVVDEQVHTEVHQDDLLVLEKDSEDVYHPGDTVDHSMQSHNQTSKVHVDDMLTDDAHPCIVVDQDCSEVAQSAMKPVENEVIADEDNPKSATANEEADEVPTPEYQRKVARLAQRIEVIEEETTPSATVKEETTVKKDGDVVIKPRKLNSKQRRARARRLEVEKASEMRRADPVATSNNISASETTSPVTVVATLEATKGATQKRKKLTRSERRARMEAQQREKEASQSQTESIPVENAATMEKSKLSEDATSDEVVSKAKKLSSKQRKAKKRAAEAAQAAATLAGVATVEPATDATPIVPDSTQATTTTVQDDSISAPVRKKLTSKERRALRDAKLAAAAAEEMTPVSVTTPVTATAPTTTANASITDSIANKESEVQQKKKKLSGKQRKAAKRRQERIEAETASKEIVATTSHSPALIQAPVEKASKVDSSSKKESPAQAIHTSTATSNHESRDVVTGDRLIAFHALLAILRQGLLSRDSVIYTQQGAMKMYLLTELCKLGYPCIEGNANSFQHITWCSTNQCLTYTTAIVNAPHQYPTSLHTKGELKIATPGLSVQLKCYPTFGAGSPALLGRKNFRNGFVRHFEEIAVGDTDCFVFVLPVGVYNEYAREAITSLPTSQFIQQHFCRHDISYVNKNKENFHLDGVFCRVDTLYGEFIVGSVMLV